MIRAEKFKSASLLVIAFAHLALLRAPVAIARQESHAAPLNDTAPLDWQGDLAARMVDGIDRFLLKKTEESVANRARHWHRDVSSHDAYTKSIEPNRQHLAHILSVRDERPASIQLEHLDHEAIGRFEEDPVIAISRIRWSAFGDVCGEGLTLLPVVGGRGLDGQIALGDVILIPDADQTPEQLAGLVAHLPPERQTARRLAARGFEVFVPTLIDRAVEPRNNRAKLSSREYLQRPAYELGRSLAGYEVQEVLALVDWLRNRYPHSTHHRPIGVAGYGEGGLIALYAAALDPRIDVALVGGAFDSRLDSWKEPVERNVSGLLDQFGGAEIASLIVPRPLILEACAWPTVDIAPNLGAAPGRLVTPRLEDVTHEVERARALVAPLIPEPRIELFATMSGAGPFGADAALDAFVKALGENYRPSSATTDVVRSPSAEVQGKLAATSNSDRQQRLIHQLDRHTQQLLAESPYTRAEFMKDLDTSTPEKFAATVEPYREIFHRDVIGRFDDPLLPPNPRSRKIYETEKLTGYEVVLDVWPDVFAYGILTLPKDLKDGEKRPVVVCQHGLEGRPRDVADPSVNNPAYNQFALRLAERGFITFSPQNPYIGEDRFRTLQRKANPLGKTLFSIIVPQHQQITDWLKTLPNVDPARIAFYGLSYGGKSAMRIPPLVKNYCLSICSADFNDWVWKNASTRSPYSYVWTGEYEIFEWDLGSTFNYAEMAALIAPRPFMVERGHFDGVAPDETVAYEFAKVRHLYNARLKLPPDHCQIEWFVGPHTIHGVGTFEFLHHHLHWPIREDQPIVPLNKAS